MDLAIYEKPLKIELVGGVLYVSGDQHPKETRTLEQMKATLKDDVEGNRDVYYMYRSVYKDNDIRYDITVIPPEPLGDECAKTHGHYHPASGGGTPYAEIYQVLHGSAVFLLQKRNSNGSVDVILVDAKEREVVIVPPGYGHVTINKGDDTLVLANLVSDKFTSDYKDIKQERGAAYYYTTDHGLVHNTNYLVHKNERLSPAELNKRYGIDAKDLLTEFYREPHKFAFLEKPEML